MLRCGARHGSRGGRCHRRRLEGVRARIYASGNGWWQQLLETEAIAGSRSGEAVDDSHEGLHALVDAHSLVLGRGGDDGLYALV